MLFFAKGVILQYKYRDNSLNMSVTSNLHSVIQYSHTKPYPPPWFHTIFICGWFSEPHLAGGLELHPEQEEDQPRPHRGGL